MEISNLYSSSHDWQNLPELIFGEIMVMAGLKRLDNFHRCRRVCQSWNVRISQMTKYKKDTIRRNVKSLAEEIGKEWSYLAWLSLHNIVTAASLAHHGLLGSVEFIRLGDVDLEFVPAENLGSLVSSAKHLDISNVSNCVLFNIMDNLKCEVLCIDNQSLSREETQALVQAMESHVKEVYLGFVGEESLDIKSLIQYSGGGKCRKVGYYDTADRNWKEVKSWAQRIKWSVSDVGDAYTDHIVTITYNQI